MARKPTLFKKGGSKKSGRAKRDILEVEEPQLASANGDESTSDEDISFPENQELPGMEVETNKDLEKKGRTIAKYQDDIKSMKAKMNEQKALALVIMKENDIRSYDKHGVHLHIEQSEDLKVEID